MPMQRNVFILFILIAVICLSGCGKAQQQTYSRDIFAMDTYITCQVIAKDQVSGEHALDAVEKAFSDVDNLTDRFDSNSQVSELNRNAGISPVVVDKELYEIVKTSLIWADKTDGVFNILIGGVMDLYGFGSEHPSVPDSQAIELALLKTDYKKIQLNPLKLSIYLPEKGMVMDLGGVAKGYATDKAVAALKKLGIKNAMINAGGNVYVLGTKAGGLAWRVGVQDPQDQQGIAAVLKVQDSALISSGDYERYFEVDGVRYHHILDPATGTPARKSAGSTIIMKSATIADILSTSLFIKGPKNGIALAEQLPQVDAVMIIDKNGKKYGTKDLHKYIVEQ